MLQRTHQNIISITSAVVLTAIIFSCQIGIWNSISPTLISQSHHLMNSMADCCQTDSGTSGTTVPNNDSSRGIFTLPDNRLPLVTISLLFLLAFFVFFSKLGNYAIYSYLKTIRIKYGGFKLFYYLSYLFSSGILNPKIY
ncbi:MAG: hypothetical protein Q7K65_01735 [Candidatus Buchananbacteria bacterium]|nr:hypothetical protein [Candidatus Buchananbacteria bacterium]